MILGHEGMPEGQEGSKSSSAVAFEGQCVQRLVIRVETPDLVVCFFIEFLEPWADRVVGTHISFDPLCVAVYCQKSFKTPKATQDLVGQLCFAMSRSINVGNIHVLRAAIQLPTCSQRRN